MSFFENIDKIFARYRTTTIRFRKEYYLIDKFNILKNNRNHPILIFFYFLCNRLKYDNFYYF